MKIFYSALSLLLLLIFSGCSDSESKINSGQAGSDSLLTEGIFPLQTKHCHGSSIVELPDKDLLAAWFMGSGERTADDVVIEGSRYNHKTRKWSSPFILADVPGFPDINPVLFTDPHKQLWLVWYTVLAYQWESSVLKYRITNKYLPGNGAPQWAWQEMIHMKPDGSTPDGIGKNDPFTRTLVRKYEDYFKSLSAEGYFNGTDSAILKEKWARSVEHYLDISKGVNLMAPGTDIDEAGKKIKTRLGYPLMRRIGWQSRNKPLFVGNRMLLPLYSDGFDFSIIAITDDFGKTWQFSEPIVGAGPVQPTLALCRDSSIVAYMRDNGPAPQRLMKSVSTDKGKTWSTVTDTEIPNPGSGADIVVLKSGNWVLVHNDLEEGRYRLSVWLSCDEGKTWPYRKILVNGQPGSQVRAHYPAIIQGSDGTIHVSFTNQVESSEGGGNKKNIAHAAFSEKWLIK